MPIYYVLLQEPRYFRTIILRDFTRLNPSTKITSSFNEEVLTTRIRHRDYIYIDLLLSLIDVGQMYFLFHSLRSSKLIVIIGLYIFRDILIYLILIIPIYNTDKGTLSSLILAIVIQFLQNPLLQYIVIYNSPRRSTRIRTTKEIVISSKILKRLFPKRPKFAIAYIERASEGSQKLYNLKRVLGIFALI